MAEKIDFTEWTDAQLEAAEHIPSKHHEALVDELNRRRASGVSDGSKERVAAMIANNPGLRGKRRPRRRH